MMLIQAASTLVSLITLITHKVAVRYDGVNLHMFQHGVFIGEGFVALGTHGRNGRLALRIRLYLFFLVFDI